MKRFPPPVAFSDDELARADERNVRSENFLLGTLTSVTLLHDYLCPWCWVGFIQAKRLTEQFGVRFDWIGAELYPPSLAGPESKPGPRPVAAVDPNNPPAKGRFELFCDEEDIQLPSPRPGFVRTHAALLAAEWAKTLGPDEFDALNEGLYRAYWENCENIEDASVVAAIAGKAGLDAAACEASVRAEAFAERIIGFDDEAYAIGVRNVPTFVFGASERLAEANYVDLARAMERFLIRAKKFGGARP